MLRHPLIELHQAHDMSGKTLDDTLLSHIEDQSVIGLDGLVTLLPEYSWSQIFHAIDRLARLGKIALRRHRSEYTLFSTDYAD